MKKLLLILSFVLLSTRLVFATIGATCAWEIRSTATGGNVNGGGYTSGGTDYSQQDAAQLNLTDFACLDTTTTLTTATGGFTAAMIGNVIHITAGTQAVVGWYEITAYTDTNTVTIDRTCAVGGQNMTAATGYVGGAISLSSTLDDDFFEQMVAGQTTWIKNGTCGLGENLVVSKTGSSATPISIEGYNATRGDAPTGTDRPLLAVAAYYWLFPDYWSFKHLRFTGTADYIAGAGAYAYFENCYAFNSSGGGNDYAIRGYTSAQIINCEAICTNGYAFSAYSYSRFINCYGHDSNLAFFTNAHGCSFTFCIAAVCDTYGFQAVYNALIANCIAYDCDTYGLYMASTDRHVIVNNIIDSCAVGIYYSATKSYTFIDYNCYNNTVDVTNCVKGAHAVTGDPLFTDPTGTPPDFTLQTGSPCLDVGLQFTDIVTEGNLAGDYKWNIGVDQDDVTAAGGGGAQGVFFID